MNPEGQTGRFLGMALCLWSVDLPADYERGLFAYHHDDYEVARQEFTLAAHQGHPDARFYLGELFEGGVGTPLDYQKAVYWYRQAAELSHAVAQFRLGVLYQLGRGVKQDTVSAFNWTLKSAENAYPLAQYAVGVRYAKGEGTPVNAIEAYKWLTIAAVYGDPDAMAVRQEVAREMSGADVRKAGQLARDWEEAQENEAAGENETTGKSPLGRGIQTIGE